MVRGPGVGFVVFIVLGVMLAPMAAQPGMAAPGLERTTAGSGAEALMIEAPVRRAVGGAAIGTASHRGAAAPRAAIVDGPCAGSRGALRGGQAISAAGDAGFVLVAYCLLLERLPDPGGLVYWNDQIDQGTSPVELVQRLIESDEYRARGVNGYRDTLSRLTLAEGRAQEQQQRADAARQARVAEGIRADSEHAARQAEQDRLATEADRARRLRVRTEIAKADFDAWVDDRITGRTDQITPALVHEQRHGGGQRINVAYVHLSATKGVSVSPGDRGRSTVGTWARVIGADVAVNGNWYAPYDGPAVSGGVVYGGADHFYTALFGFTADGDAVIEHHRQTNDGVDDRVVEGVSGHPTLVHRGVVTTDFGGDPTFTTRHPRTAIGLDVTGDVLILVTVDGRGPGAAGMTGAETAGLLAELGAHDSVMLDGGGSTTMWIEGRGIVNTPAGALRAVGNQLAVFGS